MKRIKFLFAVLLAAVSCAKVDEGLNASEGCLEISVHGAINDLTPVEEVKSTTGTVVRANWDEGDKVFVYDGSACLGTLKVSLKDGDARNAYLSNDGDISAPKPGTTKLTLVYASNATNAPAVSGGQIKIDLSKQDGANFPFVVYGTLDYTTGQTIIADKFVTFEFATSVVKVNCTGLDEDVAVSKVELTNVNTECVLKLNQTEAATVSADKLDTIARTGYNAFSTADGRTVFQIAVVNTNKATTEKTARAITLTQGKKEFISDFSAAALQSGKAYNTICEFKRAYSNRNELCFEALIANSTVRMKRFMWYSQTGIIRYPNLEYSTDGENWNDFIVEKTTVKLENVGDKVWLRGDNPDGLSYSFDMLMGDDKTEYADYSFVMTGAIAASGNIMSLIDKNCDVNVIPSAYCFSSLFLECTSLITAPELPAKELKEGCYERMFSTCISLSSAPELPAETLAQRCYCSMFGGCISLTTVPDLPAKKLERYCCANMFNGCTSLTTAPELPAKELEDHCYSAMFNGCVSLTTAPELPAKSLKLECYSDMFRKCSSLVTAPVLPASTLVQGCYRDMFNGCTSLSSITMLATDISDYCCLMSWVFGVSKSGTFIKNAKMTELPSGDSGIPNGWTVKDKNFVED